MKHSKLFFFDLPFSTFCNNNGFGQGKCLYRIDKVESEGQLMSIDLTLENRKLYYLS